MTPKALRFIHEAGFDPADPQRTALFSLVELAARNPRISPEDFPDLLTFRRARCKLVHDMKRIRRALTQCREAGVTDVHLHSCWVHIVLNIPTSRLDTNYREGVLRTLKSALRTASRETVKAE